jgi:hypothetical protein
MPSAIVANDASRTGRPAASDGGYGAHPLAWTPMTRTSGRSALTATAIPAAIPPPPMPTTIVRTSGRCSRISSPTVP